jgi:hypothetical protein
MKAPFVVLLGSALMLAGVVPGSPQTTPSPSPSSAMAPASPVDHGGYLRSVKLRMSEWRAKLADFGARASGATNAAGKNAQSEISAAWARVELAADRLGAVGQSGWGDAKAAYERAGEHLDTVWAKVRPAKT